MEQSKQTRGSRVTIPTSTANTRILPYQVDSPHGNWKQLSQIFDCGSKGARFLHGFHISRVESRVNTSGWWKMVQDRIMLITSQKIRKRHDHHHPSVKLRYGRNSEKQFNVGILVLWMVQGYKTLLMPFTFQRVTVIYVWFWTALAADSQRLYLHQSNGPPTCQQLRDFYTLGTNLLT